MRDTYLDIWTVPQDLQEILLRVAIDVGVRRIARLVRFHRLHSLGRLR